MDNSITHVYCPKCDSYFNANKTHICSHINLNKIKGVLLNYTGKPQFVNIEGGVITKRKVNLPKFSEFFIRSGSKVMSKKVNGNNHTEEKSIIRFVRSIKENLKQSTNLHFNGLTLYVDETTKKEDLCIVAKREDYPKVYYGPAGIKNAHMLIVAHKTNNLIEADGKTNVYSKEIKLPNNLLSKIKDNVKVYEAIWIADKHSTLYSQYDLVSGFIAKKGNWFYHSIISKEDAVTKLLTKIKKQQSLQKSIDKKLSDISSLSNKQRAEQFFKNHDIPLSLKISAKSSIDAGNCKIGTKDFLSKYKLSAILSHKAIDLLTLEPENTFVKRTILYKYRKKGGRIL